MSLFTSFTVTNIYLIALISSWPPNSNSEWFPQEKERGERLHAQPMNNTAELMPLLQVTIAITGPRFHWCLSTVPFPTWTHGTFFLTSCSHLHSQSYDVHASSLHRKASKAMEASILFLAVLLFS
jgi:hypothetical protein